LRGHVTMFRARQLGPALAEVGMDRLVLSHGLADDPVAQFLR